MKKSAVFLLVAVTLAFVSFVAGVYCGKNYFYTGIPIATSTETPASTSTVLTPTTTGSKPITSHPSESTPVGTTKPLFPININTATAEQLDMLPDIGPSRANAIIAYRQEYGPFSTVEDLLNVDGIGPKILEKILPYITV